MVYVISLSNSYACIKVHVPSKWIQNHATITSHGGHQTMAMWPCPHTIKQLYMGLDVFCSYDNENM